MSSQFGCKLNFLLICSWLCQQKSNLDKHKKAVHLNVKPFACGFPDCGMRFAYKHVRDNHEKTAKHVFTLVSSFSLPIPFVPKAIISDIVIVTRLCFVFGSGGF